MSTNVSSDSPHMTPLNFSKTGLGQGNVTPKIFWGSVLITTKRLKLRTSNFTRTFPATVWTGPLKFFFEKRASP